jgi:hypothetical protein
MSEGSTVKKARLKKEKPPLELLSPQPMPEIHRWLIFGLDPSLSRTGYALMEVNRDATAPPARWITVGSVKPESAADPVWLRSKLLALSLRDILREHTPQDQYTGLIISAEAPTAQNDFLVTLNRVLHVILFEGDLADQYAFTGVLQTNAHGTQDARREEQDREHRESVQLSRPGNLPQSRHRCLRRCLTEHDGAVHRFSSPWLPYDYP